MAFNNIQGNSKVTRTRIDDGISEWIRRFEFHVTTGNWRYNDVFHGNKVTFCWQRQLEGPAMSTCPRMIHETTYAD